MVVSYQLHVLTALLLAKVPTAAIKQKAWWAQKLVWISLGSDKSFAHTGKLMMPHTSCSLPSNYTN
jgi:hypothetical protein